MKTKITLALLLSLFTYAANAQFPAFYFGLKAAPQISWMKPNAETYESNGAKIGFAWGFIAERNFSANHSLSSGFNMLFNGGKLKFPAVLDGDTGSMTRNYFLKSIEIPFTLKMRTNDINGIRYFGRIGLGTSFILSSKKTDEFAGSDGNTITSSKTSNDNVAFARESLIVGLGGEYEVSGGTKLGLELTFDNGFTNILNGKNTAAPSIQAKASPNFFELAFSVIF